MSGKSRGGSWGLAFTWPVATTAGGGLVCRRVGRCGAMPLNRSALIARPPQFPGGGQPRALAERVAAAGEVLGELAGGAVAAVEPPGELVADLLHAARRDTGVGCNVVNRFAVRQAAGDCLIALRHV